MQVKSQYFLTYAVMGSLSPFMPIYLIDRGLSRAQLGQVLAAGNFAIMVTPAIVGFLADTHLDPRRLMAFLYAVAGLTIATLYFVHGFWPTLTLYALYNLAYIPCLPLEDGMNFSLQRHRASRGHPLDPYHRVRVWGSIGFVLPSLILYVLLRQGLPLGTVLFSAAVFCALGFINTFRLPEGCRPPRRPLGAGATRIDVEVSELGEVPNIAQLPPPDQNTLNPAPPRPQSGAGQSRFSGIFAAVRAMLEPHLLVYCIAMFLANLGAFAYYTIYPIYLTTQAHVAPQWVGLIINLGVVIEVFFMFSFAWLEHAMGLKRLLAISMGAIVTRYVLLGISAAWFVAIGTQVFHGFQVLVIQLIPPVYVNRCAQDHNRTTMQSLFRMIVDGSGRVGGPLAAGLVAANLSVVFLGAAALTTLAGTLLLFAFHEKSPPPTPVRN